MFFLIGIDNVKIALFYNQQFIINNDHLTRTARIILQIIRTTACIRMTFTIQDNENCLMHCHGSNMLTSIRTSAKIRIITRLPALELNPCHTVKVERVSVYRLKIRTPNFVKDRTCKHNKTYRRQMKIITLLESNLYRPKEEFLVRFTIVAHLYLYTT